MADTAIAITAGTGTNVDTRTEATNGNHRQVVVLGDPSTNAGVAPVDATAGLKVDLGSDNDITGTVTANLSATDNAVLDDIAAKLDTIDSVDFATQTTLAAVKAKTDNIPTLGQALAAASVPVILPSATITTLTPPAAITGYATSAKQDTIIGHLDGVEGLLTTIDADTGNVSTKIDTIAGAVTGTEMQVDVLTMPSTAVTNAGLTEHAAAINASSQMDVNIAASAISFGGTSAADDADFTAGTTPGTPAQGVYESTPTTVTDGDLGTVGITSGRRMKTSATIDAALPAGTNAIGKLSANSGVDIGDVDITSIAAGDNNIGNVDIVTMPTVTVNSHAVTTAGPFAVQVDGSALTSLQLADDVVATLGTTTYTEASTKGTTIGAVRRDADTTLVDTTNEIGPLQMDANGRLKVEAFSGEALPVTLTSTTVTGTVAVTQSGTWDEVGINDSGNSITVDNATISVVGSGTEATAQRVTIATDSTGVLSVDDNGSSLTIDGTVTVGNPGDIGGGTQYTEDAAAAANPVGTAPILIRTDTPATQVTTDGDNVAQRGTNYGAAYVQLVTSGGSYIDSVGGGTEYTEDVATANPIVGKAIMVERDDALTTVTPVEGDNIGLRGTAEGALWTQDFNSDGILADTTAIKTAVEIIDNAISGSEMQVDVLTMPTVTVNAHAVTNAGTFATQVDGAALTALQLIDDPVAVLGTATYTEASTKGNVIAAVRRDADTTLVDTTNEIAPLQVDARGALKVEVFSGEALPVTMTSTTVTGTVAVTQSGTWDEVGINDSGNSITVDYATTGSGTATGALRVELPTNGTGVIATVGAVTAITNALPAGTNAIGKLSANSGVDIGDVTLTAGTAAIGTLLPSDIDVTTHTNYAKKYYTNAGAVTDGIVWSPAAGKRWHVLSLFINVSAAATITFEDDKAGGDEAVLKMELAANSGTVIPFPDKYPFASGEDAADLMVTTTAGNVYITVVGYEI